MLTKSLSFKNLIIEIIKEHKEIGKFYLHTHIRTKYTLEDIIDNIFYVLKTGIPWRALQSSINWQSVYFHFKRFVTNNIFKNLYLMLRNKYFAKNKTEIQIIDSTFIANKFGKNNIARNVFFKNKNCNKISYLTDVNGVPLSVLVNSGNVHDNKFIDQHINDIWIVNRSYNKSNTLLADKAYEGQNIRNSLKDKCYKLVVPPKKNLKIQHRINKKLYKKRIKVEHTFQKLKVFRRIQIRYDSNINTFLHFIYLATSFIIFDNM